MRRALLLGLSLTDVVFLLYRLVSGAAEAGLIELPSSLMYAGYGDDHVCAWNWSFFPLDLAFSVSGLMAVRWARRDDARWRPAALVSLTLTVVAGLMAVSYWTLTAAMAQGEIDVSWYLANVVVLVWPLPFIAWLFGELAVGHHTLNENVQEIARP